LAYRGALPAHDFIAFPAEPSSPPARGEPHRLAAPARRRTGACARQPGPRWLPDWETLPYDQFSPHHDLVSERLATLYALMRGELDMLVVPASTALYRLAPREYLAAHTFFVKQGEKLDVERCARSSRWPATSTVTQVVAPGEYSVRGGLVDLFPMGAALPFRIDLFDDEVETIRTFDVDTQRTVFPCRKSACCRRANSRWTRPRRLPLSASAKPSRAIRRSRSSTRTSRTACPGRHRVLPAAVLRAHRHAVRLPAGQCTGRARRRGE
jgi:transcription-repair coupling factor (superfamily II helicase)